MITQPIGRKIADQQQMPQSRCVARLSICGRSANSTPPTIDRLNHTPHICQCLDSVALCGLEIRHNKELCKKKAVDDVKLRIERCLRQYALPYQSLHRAQVGCQSDECVTENPKTPSVISASYIMNSLADVISTPFPLDGLRGVGKNPLPLRRGRVRVGGDIEALQYHPTPCKSLD